MPNNIPVNQNLIDMEYAVRGPIPRRAMELQGAGRTIYACNIGNPQALKQKPISFYRQVLALLESSDNIPRERNLVKFAKKQSHLLEENGISIIPTDILDYSEEFIQKSLTGMGAYTESQGPKFIREAVSNFINMRDKIDIVSDPDSIFLTDGASDAARRILELLITGPNDGIMIPIPQYPLYSATVKRCGGVEVGYYPNEEEDWALTPDILKDAYQNASINGVNVKCIVIINPGNPTGAILNKNSIEDIVNFAEEYNLSIIADEVYQENLYGGSFISMASIVGSRDIPLFSLHSISKGFSGECGHRGGYMEIRNMPTMKDSNINLSELLIKQASVSLCSNTAGQAILYMMVKPPKKGSNLYETYTQEKNAILSELETKAALIKESFKQMQGVECFGNTGAMYLFPRIDSLPKGITDFDYCMKLLEETGICTVNGGGFGQQPGTNHLRIAFLPSVKSITRFLPDWIRFHNRFIQSPY